MAHGKQNNDLWETVSYIEITANTSVAEAIRDKTTTRFDARTTADDPGLQAIGTQNTLWETVFHIETPADSWETETIRNKTAL